MAGSAEIGTKTLNDAGLRAKYLDAEHRGVHVLLLLTHQPGNVHTTRKPIRTADDFKGLRIRFSAPTDRKSTRLNSSHLVISYAVFCLKKKTRHTINQLHT